MNENIKNFYRICVFGTEKNNEKAAANRAYRDMCRTIRFEKGVNQTVKNDCRTIVVELIETEIKKCKSIDTLEKYDEYRVVFAGNKPDDNITIETCGGPLICPLKIMKERFNVLTLFEVMECLQRCIDEAVKNGV